MESKEISKANAKVARAYRDAIWGLAQRLGVKDRTAVDTLVTGYTAALRGLAIDVLYPRSGVDVDAALWAIKQNHMEALDRLVATGAPAGLLV